MTKEIDSSKLVPDELLKKLKMTREQFQSSELKNLLDAMIYGYKKSLERETKRLMKEYSLSYGEARLLAHKILMKVIEEMVFEI